MDLLGISRLPFHSRRNYYREVIHLLFWSVFVGVVEGPFGAIVVSKSFHGSDVLIAIAAATPFAAHITSLGWGLLCVGRRKIPLAMKFASGAILLGGLVGALPDSPWGSIWFIAQMAAAQIFVAGVVTVRSAIWKSNYPTAWRGQIAAKLQRIRSVLGVVTVQVAAGLCDWNDEAFRLVYPATAAVGTIGVILFSRVRIRGERSQRGRRRAIESAGADSAITTEPISVFEALSPARVLWEMARILRADRAFAWYCVAMFLHGLSNLLTLPVAVAIVSRELVGGAESGFWMSTVLLAALPTLALLGSLERWGRQFDSLGVLRFRVVNVICWVLALSMGLAGTLVVINDSELGPLGFPLAVGFFSCRGLFYGLGQGGGQIAWNLGHLHFAKAEEAEIYMGIHVFLTGVRGLVAPLLGMWLWTVIGWPVWLIAIGLAISGLLLFVVLAQKGSGNDVALQ